MTHNFWQDHSKTQQVEMDFKDPARFEIVSWLAKISIIVLLVGIIIFILLLNGLLEMLICMVVQTLILRQPTSINISFNYGLMIGQIPITN